MKTAHSAKQETAYTLHLTMNHDEAQYLHNAIAVAERSLNWSPEGDDVLHVVCRELRAMMDTMSHEED